MYEFIFLLLFIFPLASSVILALSEISESQYKAKLCCTSVVFNFFSLIASVVLWSFNKHEDQFELNWISIDEAMNISMSVDLSVLSLSAVLLVSLLVLCVNIYSLWYINEHNLSRFLIYINLFSFFMVLLVTSNNFIQLFFGWEGVGLMSFFLVAFSFKSNGSVNSAFRVLIINRFADIFFLLGIISFFYAFNTFSFNVDLSLNRYHIDHEIFNVGFLSLTTTDLISILIFIGCMGKSAQIFFHGWITEAMKGPTPASALIHAATMVAAGVFLSVKCSFLFMYSSIVNELMILIGISTALVGAISATFNNNIKKIIAFSTCSHLGLMFFAVGLQLYDIAIFHLISHAFFKSLLFLCAATVIRFNDNYQKIGSVSSRSPNLLFTRICSLIGILSLVGIFPFSGYYSKELIFSKSFLAYNSGLIGHVTFLMLIFTAFFSTLYSARLLIGCFFTARLPKVEFSIENYNQKIALSILSFLALIFGFIGEKYLHIAGDNSELFWGAKMNYFKSAKEISSLYFEIAFSVLIFVLFLSSLLFFKKFGTIFDKRNFGFLRSGFYITKIYNLFAKLFCFFPMMFHYIDENLINKILIKGFFINTVLSCSRFLNFAHCDSLLSYILFSFVGLVLLLLYSLFFI